MDFFLNKNSTWILSFLLLTACQDKPDDATLNADKQGIPSDFAVQPHTSLSDSIAQLARPILSGAWLNATYMASLRKTHSPRQAHGHWGSSGITEILIDPTSYKGDSMAVALGISNHEGMPLRYVHLRQGQAANSWPTTSYAEGNGDALLEINLRYTIRNADTLLYLDQRNKKTKRVITTAFQQLRGCSGKGAALQSPPLQIPLSHFVNCLDFAGIHLLTDSVGHNSSVRFTEDGNVQGLQGHQTYEVNTDFEGPFHELDTVFLDIYQKTQQVLAFTTNGDTVRLYTVHDDTITYKRQRGRLCYTLIRQSK